MYQSLQSVVDWFREVVGIPMEKKYNSVLFGGAWIHFILDTADMKLFLHYVMIN